MREILANGAVLARHVAAEDMKEGLSFFSREEELIQAGTWRYHNGKTLPPHIHNEVKRSVPRTCEVLYVIQGGLEADIYDLQANFVETLSVAAGELLILLECGHGYRVLEDDTRVLEVKNGPYLGAEVDRERI